MAACLAIPTSGFAQKPKEESPLPKFKRAQIGFAPLGDEDRTQGRFKDYLWTPILMEFEGGKDDFPKKADEPDAEIILEGEDADGASHTTTLKVRIEKRQTKKVLGYMKSRIGHEDKIAISLQGSGVRLRPPANPGIACLEEQQRLCLNLSGRITSFVRLAEIIRAEQTRANFGDDRKRDDPAMRELLPWTFGKIDDIDESPEVWFGYQAVDLAILSSANAKFLTDLTRDPAKLDALAEWVRRGGKLIVSLDPKNIAPIRELLQSPVWNPAIAVLPAIDEVKIQSLAASQDPNNSLQQSGLARAITKPVSVVRLNAPKASTIYWEELASYQETKNSASIPLVARQPYSFGTITYVAFPLELLPTPPDMQPNLDLFQFQRMLLSKASLPVLPKENRGNEFNQMGGQKLAAGNLAYQLHDQLDHFDVQMIPFGWVALFILLYILLVGPVEYFILKKMKRLEWTWITFPAIVLGVGVGSYFTAFALKGKDQKINKVDVIDIDLRGNLKVNGEPRQAYFSGQTFFTIMTPRIQSYTLGVEVRPEFWNAPDEKLISADQVAWLGRADQEMRSGATSFFRRPYVVDPRGQGLSNITMNVWTTKNFTASWEAHATQIPLAVKLKYPAQGVDRAGSRIRGTIKNQLPFDLQDVWITYGEKFHQLPKGLPKNEEMAVDVEINQPSKTLHEWREEPDSASGHFQGPGALKTASTFKRIFFSDRDATPLFQPLDWSWRLRPWGNLDDKPIREAVICARVKSLQGDGETLAKDNAFPTRLWLGALPAQAKQSSDRPSLQGQLTEEMYLRFIVPILSE